MLKVEDVEESRETLSYAGVIEKLEILRSRLSTLRWAGAPDRQRIDGLLRQCREVRDDVVRLSHASRLATASDAPRSKRKKTDAQRKKGLLDRNFVFDGVFGESPKLLDALEIAEKAARTNLPVLIDGESGTGKELMAKVIHANSPRSDRQFVSVNCGAIPETLIESELFGHVKGAFTGAVGTRSGRFENADGGTIFLDEIGELPLQGQVKLLRVLQSNEIQRVGSDSTMQVDARVVAATNRDLKEMCQEGTFREDLFYRLSVIGVTLPPLRERRDEIPLLMTFLLDEAAEQLERHPIEISRKLEMFLLGYEYPGNVRELRNLIFRMSCLADSVADVVHLPDDIKPSYLLSESKSAAASATMSLSEVKKAASDSAERDFLEAGLRSTSGNVTEMAKQIGMNRAHLQTLLKKHGIQSKQFKATGKS